MKRSEFLKRLGLGVVAIPLVPKVITEVAEVVQTAVEKGESKEYHLKHCKELYKRYGDKGLEDVMEIYRDTGNLVYSHYEEPFIHNTKPWPLMMWDIILLPGDKTYVVTEVRYGSAVLTPHDGRDKIIIVHKGDEMIRIPNAANFNT